VIRGRGGNEERKLFPPFALIKGSGHREVEKGAKFGGDHGFLAWGRKDRGQGGHSS